MGSVVQASGRCRTPRDGRPRRGALSRKHLELRIWFNDGVNGFVALSPTQPLMPRRCTRWRTRSATCVPARRTIGRWSCLPTYNGCCAWITGDGSSDFDSLPDGTANIVGGSHSEPSCRNRRGDHLVGEPPTETACSFPTGCSRIGLWNHRWRNGEPDPAGARSRRSEAGSVGRSSYGATIGGGSTTRSGRTPPSPVAASTRPWVWAPL